MYPNIRVDFHLHSDLSDGYFSPAILAERVANAGIHFASLTDHHNLDGVRIFEEVFSRRGGVSVSGLELNVIYNDREIHILAYGFDAESPSVRKLLKNSPNFSTALKNIHETGGLVFLAHPLHTWKEKKELGIILQNMKKEGLDGIEALYGPYSEEDRASLVEMAEQNNLLVSAGSDFHSPDVACVSELGVKISSEHWKKFRNALPPFRGSINNGIKNRKESHQARKNILNWRWFILHILLPSILAIGIFVSVIFGMIIPSFEEDLLTRKREMIKELTNSAWSVLFEYEKEVHDGKMTMKEAQKNAIERIKYMRYGKEGKDYFWITDMHPNMIMHPYREDLNGTDLSNFKDPYGVKLFVEFVKVVHEKDEGYLEYVWQWKDDPERLVPKESYVRVFKPWGWIIGTGIYIEDENREIASITKRFMELSVAITLIIGLLLIYIAHQSFKIERRRSLAQRDLKEAYEKYRILVEAATEGTLMILGHRCTYANRSMLNMLGYSEAELPMLDIHDLFIPDSNKSTPSIDYIDSVLEGKEVSKNFEATIKRKNGMFLDVLLTPTRIEIAGKKGCILLAKDISGHKEIVAQLGESVEKYNALTDTINIGVFRAAAGTKWPILEANPAARNIMGLERDESHSLKNLSDIFAVPDERERFFKTLQTESSVKEAFLQMQRSNGTVSTVSVSAVLVLAENGTPRFCDGTLEDVTERRKRETEGEYLISQLQTSLLFMNEPVTNNMNPLITCPVNLSIEESAKLMTRHKYSALCITTEEDNIVGIVSDYDFRERVVSEGIDTSLPVLEIMTAPVVFISNNALVYEAILLMLEKNVRHLVVRDSQRKAIGIVRNTELLRFHNYSPAVLLQEIQRSSSMEEVAKASERLPRLVRSLINSGTQPRNLTHIVSTVADTVVERVISLAIRESGPPPVPFAFIAFGSQGREEQTLVTDQDNGIIYEDPSPEISEEAERYFKKLSERICNALNTAGYRFCKGESMARNQKWRQSVTSWKKYFIQWIGEPNSQELLQFNIFFDFRGISGELKLVNELRRHIQDISLQNPPFFFHLAKNTLQYKVPIGIFGQIVTDASGGKGNTLNIKEAMLPIVNFARLYALKNNIEETNTIDRLQGLFRARVLKKDSYQELMQAYDFLMLLRYKHQAQVISEHREPDNFINIKALTHIELTTLKQAFSHIAMVQKRIKFDFPGVE
jgi:PAS domain S-box-containing protein